MRLTHHLVPLPWVTVGGIVRAVSHVLRFARGAPVRCKLSKEGLPVRIIANVEVNSVVLQDGASIMEDHARVDHTCECLVVVVALLQKKPKPVLPPVGTQ